VPAAVRADSGIITPAGALPSAPAIRPAVPAAPPTATASGPAATPITTTPSPTPAPVSGAAPATALNSSGRILLTLGRREIRLERDGKVYGPWPVAIGTSSTPTPVGTFTVQNKIKNPQYVSTKSGKKRGVIGPEGLLGDRWIGFKQQGLNQFGIHGTPWPWFVDQRAAVTNGCVRMKHEHVRKLFELVEVGTPVVITR
jgi:lipoprotein-anchoring transpeptidase ErfK/SrfK